MSFCGILRTVFPLRCPHRETEPWRTTEGGSTSTEIIAGWCCQSENVWLHVKPAKTDLEGDPRPAVSIFDDSQLLVGCFAGQSLPVQKGVFAVDPRHVAALGSAGLKHKDRKDIFTLPPQHHGRLLVRRLFSTLSVETKNTTSLCL